MKNSFSFLRNIVLTTALLSMFIACSSGSTQSQFKDLPEICRHYDFSKDPEMAETCGIRQTRYQSYKNIPAQRYMIQPKGSTIVQTEEGVELRLPNTLPVELNKDMRQKIDFSDEKKSDILKNKYDYHEIFPTNGERLRLFKLSIPTELGGFEEYCFKVPRANIDSRRKSAVGHEVLSITCNEFQQLVEANK